MRMRRVAVAVLLAATATHAAEALKLNPFNDPFLPATAGGRACPTPLGPAYTDAQVREQSHHRAERGTTCWLEGRCAEPNAYRGDARLAQAVVQALRADTALADTRIWVTVQRAFVTLEGCVGSAQQAARAEGVAKHVEGVHLVLPYLALPNEAPRYRLATSPARGRGRG
jgi:outer membrane biogenesis lipoprotein LolB